MALAGHLSSYIVSLRLHHHTGRRCSLQSESELLELLELLELPECWRRRLNQLRIA